MIVISFGVRKSGSTLAFEMAKAVLELNGHPQTRLVDGLVEPGKKVNAVARWTDERLERLVDATEGAWVVVKTHGTPDRLSTGALFELLEARKLCIHVVFRDPRDTVLSLLDHGARSRAKDRATLNQIVTVDDAVAKLRSDLSALRRWGTYPSLKLLYDDFAFDPERGPKLIADDLGMTVDPDAVWDAVNARRTKRNVAQPHRYRSEMSAEDAARIEAAVPNYLRLAEHHDLGWFQAVG